MDTFNQTLTALASRVQEMETFLSRLVQIGTITNVENGKAQVKFERTGIPSDWLQALDGTQYDKKQIGTNLLVIYPPRRAYSTTGYILGRL